MPNKNKANLFLVTLEEGDEGTTPTLSMDNLKLQEFLQENGIVGKLLLLETIAEITSEIVITSDAMEEHTSTMEELTTP